MDRLLFLKALPAFEYLEQPLGERDTLFTGLCCFFSHTTDRYIYFPPGPHNQDTTQFVCCLLYLANSQKLELALAHNGVHLLFDDQHSFLLRKEEVEHLVISPSLEGTLFFNSSLQSRCPRRKQER